MSQPCDALHSHSGTDASGRDLARINRLFMACAQPATVAVAIITSVFLSSGCGSSPQTARSTTSASSGIEGNPTAEPERGACDVGDKANVTTFITQYMQPGTLKKAPDSTGSGEETINGTRCIYRWSPSNGDAPDSLEIDAIKYGTYPHGSNILPTGSDNDAESAIRLAEANLMNERHWHGGEFDPITVSDIGAGAVFGMNEFQVMGRHGYYYEISLSDWIPTPDTTPAFKTMAQAIANADDSP